MAESFINDIEFISLMKSHAKECLEYLLDKNLEFSIASNTKLTIFEPKLPDEIKLESHQLVMLFYLSGYSLSSVDLSNKLISFEAAFGPDNFLSLVQIPFEAILQIFVYEKPIFTSIAAYNEKEEESRTEKSKKIFMSNPENNPKK